MKKNLYRKLTKLRKTNSIIKLLSDWHNLIVGKNNKTTKFNNKTVLFKINNKIVENDSIFKPYEIEYHFPWFD